MGPTSNEVGYRNLDVDIENMIFVEPHVFS